MGREIDAYRGRWRGSTRAWACRRWTSSRDGVAGGAGDGDGCQAQETAVGSSLAGTGDAGPPRAGSSSDGGRRGTSSRGGSCRSTALCATQQQRGGAGPMRSRAGEAGPGQGRGGGTGPGRRTGAAAGWWGARDQRESV